MKSRVFKGQKAHFCSKKGCSHVPANELLLTVILGRSHISVAKMTQCGTCPLPKVPYSFLLNDAIKVSQRGVAKTSLIATEHTAMMIAQEYDYYESISVITRRNLFFINGMPPPETGKNVFGPRCEWSEMKNNTAFWTFQAPFMPCPLSLLKTEWDITHHSKHLGLVLLLRPDSREWAWGKHISHR